MLYRTTTLFLLACALGAYPALDANRSTAVCADRFVSADSAGASANALAAGMPDASGCKDLYTQTQVERLMQVLAAVFAIGGCASAVKGWRDREQDRALLRGAPMPAWGRGARYR